MYTYTEQIVFSVQDPGSAAVAAIGWPDPRSHDSPLRVSPSAGRVLDCLQRGVCGSQAVRTSPRLVVWHAPGLTKENRTLGHAWRTAPDTYKMPSVSAVLALYRTFSEETLRGAGIKGLVALHRPIEVQEDDDDPTQVVLTLSLLYGVGVILDAMDYSEEAQWGEMWSFLFETSEK